MFHITPETSSVLAADTEICEQLGSHGSRFECAFNDGCFR